MMGEYDAGYEHYIDSLIREIEKLQDENDKLREQVSSIVGRSFRTADKMSCIEADNAKLRELVRDVYTLHWNGLDCTECPWFDECDTTGGCPWLSILADRMRELGVTE